MFWENYFLLCQSINKSPNSVAAEMGLSSGSVTAWKSGRVPKWATLCKIAEYFNISVDQLLSDNPTKRKPLTEPDEELDENVLVIRGRDGRYLKKRFSDEQIKMLEDMIKALPDLPEDL